MSLFIIKNQMTFWNDIFSPSLYDCQQLRKSVYRSYIIAYLKKMTVIVLKNTFFGIQSHNSNLFITFYETWPHILWPNREYISIILMGGIQKMLFTWHYVLTLTETKMLCDISNLYL